MTPFEQMWESSRHNAFSGNVAAVNQVAFLILVLAAFIPNQVWLVRWIAYICTIFVAAWYTTDFSSRDIEEKWRIRWEYVKMHEAKLTEDERNAVTIDGANRVLGPISFGAFTTFKQCGFVLLAIFATRYLISKRYRSHAKSNPGTVGDLNAIPEE